MTDRLLTLGWRGRLELLPALLLLRCSILLAALNGFPTLLLLRRRVFNCAFAASRRCWVDVGSLS